MVSLLVALAALTLLSLCSARTFIDCACSPSKRGYRSGARADLLGARREIQLLAKTLQENMKTDASISEESIQRSVTQMVIVRWASCIGNFNKEECVNADAFLRTGTCAPNCDSFCNYNPTTWVNVAKGRSRPACDTVDGFKSNVQTIVESRPDFPSAVRPSPSPVKPSPSRRPRTATVVPPPATSKAATTSNAASASTGPTAIPVGAGTSTAGSSGTSSAANPTRTPLPGTSSAQEPSMSPVGENETFGQEPPATRNEGCVAVEHLSGYVLQHATHLRRGVLCAHNFCATPNHAILVDDVLTSMKVMCASEWKCVRSVKLVNNLKLAYNRRARVSARVTVTPYDLRFPKWGVWVVQIAEDVLHLVGVSVAAAGVAVVALAAAARSSV